MTLNIVGQEYKHKIKLIHIGVKHFESAYFSFMRGSPFTVVVPASFYRVKGHKYLIDACSRLKKHGISGFQCIFYGEGYLENELRKHITENGLNDCFLMPGPIPNEQLLDLYMNRKVDTVLLPSINTSDGEHEGIPVALMEAMSYGIPVISTNTGGIKELLGNECGIIVNEKDPEAIADAIETLMTDSTYYRFLSERGREKIKKDFNIDIVTQKLLNLLIGNDYN